MKPKRAHGRIAAAALGLLCCAATANAGSGPSTATSIERHWTSNALDSDRATPDWYTLLRGSIEQKFGDDDANMRLAAEFQATRHDTVSIEDDRALALAVEAFGKIRPGLELRGSLTYRIFSDGDDLQIGPLTLGTRRLKQIVGATGQAGIDLGNATSLIVDVSESLERTGPTHFENDLLLPARLDPDISRTELGARLTRKSGRVALGASGSALFVAVERLGSPPVGISLERYALRGELAYSAADGSTLGLALGGEMLRGADVGYARLRPAWQASFTQKLPHALELRGTYFGRYETTDSDDPLASWVQRAELELGMKLRENLDLASGIFAEAKENLLFENVERKNGFYAELACAATPTTAIVLRLDYSRTRKTVIDVRQHTLDTFIGFRAKI